MTLQDQPHPFTSFTLHDTWYRFGDPELLKAWNEAPQLPRRIISPGIQSSNSLYGDDRRHEQVSTKSNYAQLTLEISEDIKKRLKSGYLVAWGRDSNPSGEWVELPKDVWLDFDLNFRSGIASHNNGYTYFNVQVSRVVVCDGKWSGGLKFPDAEELLGAHESSGVEESIIRFGDLYLWVKPTNSEEWVRYSGLSGNEYPSSDTMDVENSTVSILDFPKPLCCIVSNLSNAPADNFNKYGRRKVKGRLYLLKEESVAAYKSRIENLKKEKTSSNRPEDLKWGAERGISNIRMRELRNEYAPEDWQKRGRKPKSRKSD